MSTRGMSTRARSGWRGPLVSGPPPEPPLRERSPEPCQGADLPTIGLPHHQVFDLALSGCHGPQELVVERSDGHQSSVDLGWWREDQAASAPADLRSLELATEGPVLDVWCRSGRRLDLLAARGLPGRGIDTCREAVAMGRRRGRSCALADLCGFWPPLEFGTVLALDGSIGVVGGLDALPAMLSRLAALVFPGGAVLAGSIDWRVSAAQDVRFIDRQRRDQRYPGEVRLRLRYGPARSTWFGWVWVDRDAMIAAARSAGLAVTGIWSWRHHYVARLVRPATLTPRFPPDRVQPSTLRLSAVRPSPEPSSSGPC